MADKVTKIAISDNNPPLEQSQPEAANPAKLPTAENAVEKHDEKAIVSGEKRIEPLNKDTTAETPDEPAVNHEIEDNPKPDPSQLMTAKAEADMQNPRLFDTKQYHLPITQSVHGHSWLVVSIIFGVIFTVVLAAAILYFLQ